MITPINIALLGVVLAAVALVILRRRHSGATDEALSSEAPDDTLAPFEETAVADRAEVPDVFASHIWAEAAATVTPVREDEALTLSDTDPDAEDTGAEAEVEDDEPAVEDDELEPEEDAEDLDAESGEQGQDSGIEEFELEAMADLDDGLGEIITEPGWYLPGETDMTRGSPGAASGLLVPDDDLAISDGELEDELGITAEASPSPLLGEGGDDFDATAGWSATPENGTQEPEPTWLGLADEEGAAAAVPAEHEISFEDAPTPSDDLFALPPLAEGFADEQDDLTPPSLSLDRWQDPAAPTSFAIGGPAADMTVAQHGPLTVSIDPAALLAIETEGVERSTSGGDGDVSWELTLKVHLRQRANAPTEAD